MNATGAARPHCRTSPITPSMRGPAHRPPSQMSSATAIAPTTARKRITAVRAIAEYRVGATRPASWEIRPAGVPVPGLDLRGVLVFVVAAGAAPAAVAAARLIALPGPREHPREAHQPPVQTRPALLPRSVTRPLLLVLLRPRSLPGAPLVRH